MFEFALHEYITNNLNLSDFPDGLIYGTAENTSTPYLQMFKVSDPEERMLYCDSRGESGQATLQFTCYAGGENGQGSSDYTVKLLNDFKTQFIDVRGKIESPTHGDYIIYQNITQGVRLIEAQELNTWGVIFESLLWWDKV